jgi:hypothetical protein
MKLKHAAITFAGMTLTLMSIVDARADQIIYSNFGPGQSFNAFSTYDISNGSGSPDQFLAFSFTPTANYFFTEVDAAIFQGDGAVTADVFLAANSAGQPGQVLYSAAVAVPALGGVVSAPVGSMPVELLENQTYWLYLGTPIPNATLGWFMNSTDAVGPIRSFNGSEWITGTPGTDTQGAFSISGNLRSVPEPASVILLGLGILGLLTCAPPGEGHRSIPVLCLVLGLMMWPASSCHAEDVTVALTIERMRCIRPTDNEFAIDGNPRDEVYMYVSGKTPVGDYRKPRLPREDDYYEFWSGTRSEIQGWTNKDQQRQGPPILWKGKLAEGQVADFHVEVAEQDNKDLKRIKEAINKIMPIFQDVNNNNKIVDARVIKIAEQILNVLPAPDGDDIIGDFVVSIKNEAGHLVSSWKAVRHCEIVVQGGAEKSFGDGAEFFRCRGNGRCEYEFIANAAEINVEPKTTLPEVTIGSVASAYHKGRLLVAWTGTDCRLNLISSNDGMNFVNKVIIEEHSYFGPALASHGGALILAWTGTDRRLNVRAGDGDGRFIKKKVVLEETSAGTPALCSHKGNIVLGWAGTDANNRLNLLLSKDATVFRNKVTLDESSRMRHSSQFLPGECSLAMTSDGAKSYIAWSGTDGRLNVLSSKDGVRYARKVTLEEFSHSPPSLTCANGRVYLAWTALPREGRLRILSSANGVDFGNGVYLLETSDFGPSLTVDDRGAVHIGWRGTDPPLGWRFTDSPFGHVNNGCLVGYK